MVTELNGIPPCEIHPNQPSSTARDDCFPHSPPKRRISARGLIARPQSAQTAASRIFRSLFPRRSIG